jgi:DNA-directed RNA polymerase subunit alpha
MLRTKNFGRKSLNEIKEILSNLGLGFGMKFDAQGRLVPAPGSLPHFTPGPEEDDEQGLDEAPE